MVTKRKFLIGAVFSTILAMAGFSTPSFAENIKITHASGESEVPLQPKKVVVFDLASLDNLQRLGAGDTVIALPEIGLPKYLEAFSDKKITKVGTLFEPNYELIASLKPDLIIAGGRSQPKLKELAAIAPTIDTTVSTDNYLGDVDRNVEILGKIFGKEAEAKAEIEKLAATLAEVKKEADGKGNGLLILTTGGKMSAFGPGSRFGLLYSGFGVSPAVADLPVGRHGQPISSEYILEKNPDWLFVIDRDAAIGREGQSAAQMLDNPVVNESKVAQKKHIVYLDPQNWYLVGGGLSGLHETADQLMKAFKAADAK